MLEIWNGSETGLQEGLSALEERKILKKIISDQDSRDIYVLTNVAQWEEM
jgi:hypothetical protein